MKTFILIIIVIALTGTFLASAMADDESVDFKKNKDEEARQQLVKREDEDINLDEE